MYTEKLSRLAKRYRDEIGPDYAPWAEQMLEEFGEGIEPYLEDAWELGLRESKVFSNEDRDMSEFKLYGKKILAIAVWLFLWVSLFLGMNELLHKILPNDLIYWKGDEGGYSDVAWILSLFGSLLALQFMYKGYEYHKDGHWNFLPFLNNRISEVIDRDKLIYDLEKKCDVINNICILIDKKEEKVGSLISDLARTHESRAYVPAIEELRTIK